jgi:hypothetical protein
VLNNQGQFCRKLEEITFINVFYSIMNIFFDAEHREAHIFEVSELM